MEGGGGRTERRQKSLDWIELSGRADWKFDHLTEVEVESRSRVNSRCR